MCLIDTSFYICEIEEHIADLIMFKELNSDPTQAIRNDVLSTTLIKCWKQTSSNLTNARTHSTYVRSPQNP